MRISDRRWQIIGGIGLSLLMSEVAQAKSLTVVYPPANHQTTAASIFIIGSAPASGNVTINGKPVKRSSQGNFAPSFPLRMGSNEMIIRYGTEEIKRTITRKDNQPAPQEILNLSANLLTPATNISRLPQELICFTAIAPVDASTSVTIANKTIPLTPALKASNLPPNSAVLIAQNQPQQQNNLSGEKVSGCTNFDRQLSNLSTTFTMNHNGQTLTRESKGKITILDPQNLTVVEVTSEQGVARTGPSTNHSRLTPLPKGTRAAVTGTEGEWLRLDYGGWIKAEETQILPTKTPPRSIIRSVSPRVYRDRTEVIFPLESPVPISIQQGEQSLTLSLHNTTAQTDTIRFDDNPIVKRLDWYQTTPERIDYTFHFKSAQQWGFDTRYEGNSLILTLNHDPQLRSRDRLDGISILLDPGHGGDELGALGPTGYPEKDVNLVVSKLLAEQLKQRGAKVYLTRETDKFVSLSDRQQMINKLKPTLAFSIHYNALPDAGNAEETKGVSMFWYHPQAHDVAVFLHNYLIEKLDRDSYGIFWNNLALTRPHTAPTVLVELGFMINPEEFEWISNPQAQQNLALTLADGISAWIQSKVQ